MSLYLALPGLWVLPKLMQVVAHCCFLYSPFGVGQYCPRAMQEHLFLDCVLGELLVVLLQH